MKYFCGQILKITIIFCKFANVHHYSNVMRLLAIVILLCHFTISAQDISDNTGLTETPDSQEKVSSDALRQFQRDFNRHYIDTQRPLFDYTSTPLMSWQESGAMTFRPYNYAIAGIAPIATWESGAFYAAGSRAAMPGLMGIESGSLNISQQIGNVTFTGSLNADKYGYYRGLNTTYGVSGNMVWRINDTFSLTVFGSHSFNSMYINPQTLPYMRASGYGGYLGINLHEHWGVNVGARRVYNSGTGRWETIPIMEPYYRLNKRDVIGVDLGGILYEVIRANHDKHFGGPRNPTIGPPIPMGPPPVRLHE